MTVVMANQSMGLLRTEFIAAKLTGANFTGAGLGHVTFRYASCRRTFRRSRLEQRGVRWRGPDRCGFHRRKLTGATFESATLTAVKGLGRPGQMSREDLRSTRCEFEV